MFRSLATLALNADAQVQVACRQEAATAPSRCKKSPAQERTHLAARPAALLVCTSYPGSGTVALLKRLPPNIDCWHFGDSDDAGFEILRVLQGKSGRNFRSLHMQAGRIPFEQESLGRPTGKTWPFYG